MAISVTSNSRPRTIRRNALMITGTSSNSNAKPRGLTVPSFRPCVWPRVTRAVLSFMAISRFEDCPIVDRRPGPQRHVQALCDAGDGLHVGLHLKPPTAGLTRTARSRLLQGLRLGSG